MSVALLLEEVRSVGGEVSLRDNGDLHLKAPRGAITPDLQARLKASKELILAVLRSGATAREPEHVPIAENALATPVPLSHAQQRLWFMEQLSPGSAFLNLPGALRIRGPLDVPALAWAVAELGKRHDVLRSSVVVKDDLPHQIVHELTLELAVHDLSTVPAPERAAAFDAAIAKAARRPLDCARAPMVTFDLFKRADGDHTLLFVVSHVIFDGSSRDLLFRDLRLLYEARTLRSPVPDAPRMRFRDFAKWHREWLTPAKLETEITYWKKYLAGMPPTIDLPTDVPRALATTYGGREVELVLEPLLLEKLRATAKAQRASFSMLALAAAELVIAGHTGQPDFGVGVPVHGRLRPECEGVLGMFVNTLVMRSAVAAGGTFAELLSRVRDSMLDGLQHENLPFEQLVQAIQPARERNRTPLFQAMFSHQHIMTHASPGTGLTLEDVPVFAGAAATDITFWMFEYEGHAVAAIETASDLFDAEATARFARSWRRVLAAIAENVDTPLDQLPLLAEQDERHLLFGLNETRAPWNDTDVAHRKFERTVDRRRDHTALLFEEERMTYGELDTRANQLAHLLVLRGVGPESRVAIFLRRGLDMVVSILAVQKAGASYVPLDPMFPADRVEYVLADSGAHALLTTSDLATRLATHPELVLFDRDAALMRSQPTARLPGESRPDSLAYVIYTSGSTGRPKGVMVEHRNLISFFVGMEHATGLDENGVWLSATTIAFDISILELLGSLCHGRTIALVGDTVMGEIEDPRYAIPALVLRHGVTHFQCTPTQCRMLLIDDSGRAALRALKQLIVGGEALPQDLADELVKVVGGEVVNAYGPTETTIWSTSDRVRPGAKVSIGRPIANTVTFVLDPAGRPVPFGAIGELCIGGPGVTRGYLGRPELTAEKFITNKLRPDIGGRLYRTGDLVKYAGDGTLTYLGRNDHQVKIRGFRIELGEIEELLRKMPGVEDAAVIALGEDANKRLVAYLVTSGGTKDDDDIRTTLRASVPEYMVPSAFMRLPALPLTPNGKLDRKALPEPTGTTSAASTYVEPQDQVERTLAEIWQGALRLPRVSVTDDFFALGGHSLLAVQIFNAIEKQYGVRLPLATLFERPSIRLLGEKLRERTASKSKDTWSTVVAMRPAGKLPPFFCVAGLGGNPLNLLQLSRQVGDDQPFYGIQHRGVDGVLKPHRTIRAMAEEFFEDIREVQPHGPYYVGGFSAGGLAAYEVARMLLDAGEEVGLLVLLDTSNPSILDWTPKERLAAHVKNLKRMGPSYLTRRAAAMVERKYLNARQAVRARLGAKVSFDFREDEVVDATQMAERSYEALPLASNVLLIQADSEVPAENGIGYPAHESNGWRGLVAGLEIEPIKSNHRGLVTEEIAPQTGSAIRRGLERARATRSS
ncbi:MAG: linear gramicidin synthase subunit [Myxococcaceae bacterium]|nr:linear gramicidin synthase subunit [Myxococcaceae bacterium]